MVGVVFLQIRASTQDNLDAKRVTSAGNASISRQATIPTIFPNNSNAYWAGCR